jgi:phage protein D
VPLGEEFSHSLVVKVDGQVLPDAVEALMVSGYVEDSSLLPDVFVLRFSDDAVSVLEDGGFRIGSAVQLLVQSSGPGGPVPLLTGEVTALETEVSAEGTHTVVRGFDKSHRLLRGRRVEAYLNVSAADIARTVARRAGLAAGTINHQGPVLEHVAQDGVSDWDFLCRLAEEAGASFTVVNGALDFAAPPDSSTAPSGEDGSRQDPLVIERGVNLLALRAGVTAADQVPQVEVRGWDVAGKRELVAVAPASTPSATLTEADPATLAGTFGSPAFVTPYSTLGEQGRCTAAAQSLAAHLAGGFAELEGTVRGNPSLRAGTPVALVNVGKPFEGSYTLTMTRHEFTPELGYLTSFAVSGGSERSLYGLAAGATGARTPTLPGVVSAIVTDLKDPDHFGRVKVRFPVMSGDYESWWARTVQPGAGASRGAMVLPEVGDEVLVAFGQNSFQQPYILGGLYNGQDKPDKALSVHVNSTDGKVTRRSFTSRTGMLVEFIESPQGEQLTLSTNAGSQLISLVQGRQPAVKIVSEGPLDVTAKQDVTVTSTTGNVKITGTNVVIEAKANLDLKGATVKVTGQGAAEMQAAAVKVAGQATAELSASAVTTVRGGIVRIN